MSSVIQSRFKFPKGFTPKGFVKMLWDDNLDHFEDILRQDTGSSKSYMHKSGSRRDAIHRLNRKIDFVYSCELTSTTEACEAYLRQRGYSDQHIKAVLDGRKKDV